MKQKKSTDPEKETRRLIGLSDGLFATVLTLLVLDLRIPDLSVQATGIQIHSSNGSVHIYLDPIRKIMKP